MRAGLDGVEPEGSPPTRVCDAVRLVLGTVSAVLPEGAIRECAEWVLAHARVRLGRGPVERWMWTPAVLAHLMERVGFARLVIYTTG